MVKKITLILVLLTSISAGSGFTELGDKEKVRENVVDLLRSAGMNKQVDAPVTVKANESGVVEVEDTGSFLMQYVIVGPRKSTDPNVVFMGEFNIPPSAKKAVIITHGWMDEGIKDWPGQIANQISSRVDPNEWICAVFDWHGGAAVINPIDAAKYARDIAGPRLAKTVLTSGIDLEHIHLIGHSAGSWVINSAAQIIARETNTVIHLTFLDAYVPPGWDSSKLGKNQSNGWNEHYYTKDYTQQVTEMKLQAARNVDLTDIEPGLHEHKFPYRWYYATITGSYGLEGREKRKKLYFIHGDIEYGFSRSAEAGQQNWQKSLTLKKGNNPIVLKKDKTLLKKIKFWK
jgi:pimeloyl-ACP methyl ester carboxylesterase